jgi:predicted metalloprotease with PDZ domain
MNKTVLTVIMSLVAGFAAGAWSMSATQPDSGQAADPADYFDAEAPAADRLAALERIVSEERDARLVLEEQLQALLVDFDNIDIQALQELLQMTAQSRIEMEQVRTSREDRAQMRRAMRDFSQMRANQLVNGGFSEERANQIMQLEDQVRMDALQAEYEAQRAGTDLDRWDQAYNAQASLREKLGDADFERYLQAHGSQAAITVREVIGSSPASRAGLRPGDEIVGYDGNRVYSMFELRSKAFDGNPGEDVIVDIERDGQRMQLVLPRGPMGISGNGANMISRNPFGG